ncbi:MAG: hypothetical protein AB7V55_02635 [Oscillospiraceae bacterium]|jgi:hypothetical protein
MKAVKQFSKKLAYAQKKMTRARKQLMGMGKSAMAGVAGAALVAGNAAGAIRKKARDVQGKTIARHKKSGEVIVMKKSTVIALLVALAAVAGVLGALYFYVIRRERELDEYEQLLFSEDFNDDLMDDDEDFAPEEEPAADKAKA